MLLARLHPLFSQLTCLWLATVSTATITPSNTSTVRPDVVQDALSLVDAEDNGGNITNVLALTEEAAKSVEANLYYANFSNVANISSGDIAYISCNPDDYTGFDNAQRVFEQAYQQANITAVILYSTATNYCNYSQHHPQDMIGPFAVYSMTNRNHSALVLDAIGNPPAHRKYFVRVERQLDDDSNDGDSSTSQTQNPLGPSPSTAVAMIILYSITGIITALFLVIIITGAVRAHRHPERYGPRNVLGRPRQSRARGLGRAILDTIPIVKFGEKEPTKPADVELGSTADTRDVTETNAASGVRVHPAAVTDQHDAAAQTASGGATESRLEAEEHQSGIAPAQPVVTTASAGTNNTSPDESLVCSICTEDFEKGQDLRVLPCDHKFHPECVDPWLLNVSGTCPLCRVDLRPVASHDSSASQDQNELAPPLDPEAETSHRRRIALRDILSLRQRPNASAEERISALRRLREQRRNQSGELAGGSTNASVENVANTRDRRSRRISARLSDVFTGRARRERRDESPGHQGDSAQTPPRDGPPRPNAGIASSERQAQ